MYVARNPNTPVEVLNILSKDSYDGVRRYVAQNPNTPVEMLNILSKDSYDDVRINVAGNPNTPVETLNILSKDSDSYVRGNVALNPNTPVEALNILSKDRLAPREHSLGEGYDDVRYNVAQNPNAPVEVLNILSKDSDEYVRETAKQNLRRKQANTRRNKLIRLAETTRQDLSYSYIMRKLRKGDKNMQYKFQKVFKKSFDDAIDHGLEMPEKIALMAAIKEISFSE
jgi:hypothetical protein